MNSTTAVAIAAILGTALTAIAGLIVQLLIASRTLRRDKRKRRYDELIDIYARVGFSMSMATAIVERLSTALLAGEETWPRHGLRRQLDTHLIALDPPTSIEHARRTLRLFGASTDVLASFDQWREVILGASAIASSEQLSGWIADGPGALSTKLDEYHVVASAHARSKL